MITITGALRHATGTGNARRLRKDQRIPVVLYGKQAHHLLSIEHKTIFYAQENDGFYTTPIMLEWTNEQGALEEQQVVIKEIQRHPFKNQILHVDFSIV